MIFCRLWINPVLMALLLSVFAPSHCVAVASTPESGLDVLSQGVRRCIEEQLRARSFSCKGEILCGISLIPQFYRQLDYRPAWGTQDGLFEKAYQLIDAIRDAGAEGLAPENYHLSRIEKLVNLLKSVEGGMTPENGKQFIDLDMLLTDAFFLYASHLMSGRINPETIHSEWEAFSPEIDLTKALETALDSGQIRTSLQALIPQHPAYIGLRETLAQYRKIRDAGGWPMTGQGKVFKKGDCDDRVQTLKSRLLTTGDLNPVSDEKKNLFGDFLEHGVKGFQQRHGLTVDGAVGPKTIAALNVSVEDRIRQLELNMERFRWIPADLGERHLFVNIADFRLTVVEHGKPVMDMRVIAGKPYRKTPVFSGKMEYLVINPYWTIPPKIAAKDVVPRICKNRDYLSRKKIEVFAHWGDTASKLDPEAIDWCHIKRNGMRFRLRQQPGPQNPLGRIKFIFPNKYSVYLHDTPERSLFDKTIRDFSSGCIRVEKPTELASYLIKNDTHWTPKRVSAAIEEGKRKVIPIPDPVFVHLLYLTSWTDEQGIVQFRDDIYERDIDLDRALRERPPGVYDAANR